MIGINTAAHRKHDKPRRRPKGERAMRILAVLGIAFVLAGCGGCGCGDGDPRPALTNSQMAAWAWAAAEVDQDIPAPVLASWDYGDWLEGQFSSGVSYRPAYDDVEFLASPAWADDVGWRGATYRGAVAGKVIQTGVRHRGLVELTFGRDAFRASFEGVPLKDVEGLVRLEDGRWQFVGVREDSDYAQAIIGEFYEGHWAGGRVVSATRADEVFTQFEGYFEGRR